MNNIDIDILDSSYEDDDKIKLLRDVDAVRQVPEMYIGNRGNFHLLVELISNSLDAIDSIVLPSGEKNTIGKISVLYDKENNIYEVSDNAGGIPFGINSSTKKSYVETAVSYLHAGGKFIKDVYKTSSGLHGVGVTVVNALSSYFEIINSNSNEKIRLVFERGKKTFSEILERDQYNFGVTIKYTPDQYIFSSEKINPNNIRNFLNELARLNNHIEITFAPDSKKIEEYEIIHFSGGQKAWMEELNKNPLESTNIFHKDFSVIDKNDKDSFIISLTFQYSHDNSDLRYYCNNVRNEEGGTHALGFERGLLNVIKDWIVKNYTSIKEEDIKGLAREDVIKGLNVILSLKINEPRFAGQTKEKLTNKGITAIVRDFVQREVISFFDDNRDTAIKISEKVLESFRARLKSIQSLIFSKEGRNVSLPLELLLCETSDPEKRSLFIVEGISARGSVGGARDKRVEEVLPVRGKLTNAEKNDSKVLGNDQIIKILQAMGLSLVSIYESNYDISKLRHNKYIIVTDPDKDGLHITNLIVTFFFNHLREVIDKGHLYLCVIPLFALKNKKETLYFNTEEQFNSYKNLNQIKGFEIHRFKGIGEINAKDLIPLLKNIYQLKYDDLKELKDQINVLMGIKSDERKKILESGHLRNFEYSIKEGRKIDLSEMLLDNFVKYAYMVIENRAIPNISDGLKNVQRRVIYSIYSLGLFKNYRKSAKVVGDTIGKFHPHGEMSVYKALVKLTQEFIQRYPLVKGQGNFGSIGGDPEAASRYTEVKLSEYGLMFFDYFGCGIETLVHNFDETEKEPLVIHPPFPNLIINGASGIAVGMSTNIPPHNIKEIMTAVVKLVKSDNNLSDEELFSIIKGPDFPTGGIILNSEEIPEIYSKGYGSFCVRAKAEINTKENYIKIFEIPYKTNNLLILEEITAAKKNGLITGIKSAHDYSDLKGIDIRIFLEKETDALVVLHKLYQKTKLQTSFDATFRAISEEGRAKIFNLREILESFINRRLEDIAKKSLFLSNKIKNDLLAFENQLFIIENYEEIGRIVKEETDEEARNKKLIERFNINQNKLDKILDTPASFRNFSLDRVNRLKTRINHLLDEKKYHDDLAENNDLRKEYLIKESEKAMEIFEEERRTEISEEDSGFDPRKLIESIDKIVILRIGKSDKKINSYISIRNDDINPTISPSVGKKIVQDNRNLSVKSIIKVNSRDDILLVSSEGMGYIVPFYSLMERRTSGGHPINLSEFGIVRINEGEFITKIFPWKRSVIENSGNKYLLIITAFGKIKKMEISKVFNKEFKRGGKRLVSFSRDDDEIVDMLITSGEDNIIYVSSHGKYKLINENVIPVRLNTARGDNSLKITEKDRIIGIIKVDKSVSSIVFIDEENSAKKTDLGKYKYTTERTGAGYKVNGFSSSKKIERSKGVKNCEQHRELLENHKTMSCCGLDVKNEISSISRCSKFREIKKIISECNECSKKYSLKSKHLNKIFPIRGDESGIYVMTKEYLSYYSKDDFMSSKENKRRTLYQSDDPIIDIFISH